MFRTSQTPVKFAILVILMASSAAVCLGFKFWFEDSDPNECPPERYAQNDADYQSKDVEPKHRSSDYQQITLRKDRVLVWVMTYPPNHKSKAMHVKATWGKRFDRVLYMSSVEDKELPSIALPVVEDRDNLWNKTKEAFKYVYSHYNGTYDWVLKADDDTYVIAENLRHFLSHYDPNEPLYLGCKFKKHVKQGYMQGGAGYVLSREAVKRLVVDGVEGGKCCNERAGSEDVGMGLCMEVLGVKTVDTRDHANRGLFHSVAPEEILYPGPIEANLKWYSDMLAYPAEKGSNCCSDETVSFHYVSPAQMYVMDFFIYRFRRHETFDSSSNLITTPGGV